MPNTIEDKILLFTKVIVERIELDFQQKQKKLLEYYENRKATIIKDNEERKRTVVAITIKDAETKKQQLILKTQSAMHLAVLKKRREFAESIMDEIKKTLTYKVLPLIVEFQIIDDDNICHPLVIEIANHPRTYKTCSTSHNNQNINSLEITRNLIIMHTSGLLRDGENILNLGLTSKIARSTIFNLQIIKEVILSFSVIISKQFQN